MADGFASVLTSLQWIGALATGLCYVGVVPHRKISLDHIVLVAHVALLAGCLATLAGRRVGGATIHVGLAENNYLAGNGRAKGAVVA